MTKSNTQKHFVLVHGACHGAWCWFKLKPLLENAGHRVTALDMAASGINPKTIYEINTLRDYTEPLLSFLASIDVEEKVILVGHSLGGLNIATAMEMFPEKIEIAVFLAAFMPDTEHTPSFITDKFAEVISSEGDYWLDTKFTPTGDDPMESLTIVLVGPKYLAKVYHLSPIEDLELAILLKRPTSLFSHDVWRPETKLSEEKYGSVRRVYVVCDEDKGISREFQLWMVENSGVLEVEELNGTDHMPMMCIPQELCDCLVNIADN